MLVAFTANASFYRRQAGAYKIEGGMNGGGVDIAKDILTGLGVVLFFTGTAGVSGIVLTVLAIVTVFLAIYAALLKAIEILDEGGNCAAATAEMYFGVATMLTAIATLFKISSTPVDKLVFKLIGSMYGSELFKSVAGSRACH